jgi:hypothetical protein
MITLWKRAARRRLERRRGTSVGLLLFTQMGIKKHKRNAVKTFFGYTSARALLRSLKKHSRAEKDDIASSDILSG